jgi:hypothetical protein
MFRNRLPEREPNRYVKLASKAIRVLFFVGFALVIIRQAGGRAAWHGETTALPRVCERAEVEIHVSNQNSKQEIPNGRLIICNETHCAFLLVDKRVVIFRQEEIQQTVPPSVLPLPKKDDAKEKCLTQ